MNDFEKRFDYYLCSVIYQNMKIMVNDINPIIEALKIFIDDIVLTPKNDVRLVYRLSPFEIYINGDENIKEYRIDNNQNYDCTIINLDVNNVASYFKDEKNMYFDKLKEKDIIIPKELYMKLTSEEKYAIRWHMGFTEPKELYGTLFVCLILSINHYIESNTKFMEEINIHDMFIFSSVDGHNVIRRVD